MILNVDPLMFSLLIDISKRSLSVGYFHDFLLTFYRHISFKSVGIHPIAKRTC
jgi:hypothetical protein